MAVYSGNDFNTIGKFMDIHEYQAKEILSGYGIKNRGRRLSV